jgi:hypothetical protein
VFPRNVVSADRGALWQPPYELFHRVTHFTGPIQNDDVIGVIDDYQFGMWNSRRHVDGVLDREDRVFSAVQ